MKTWIVKKTLPWNKTKRKRVCAFVVHDEFGKTVGGGPDASSAVRSALKVAAQRNVAVQIVGA